MADKNLVLLGMMGCGKSTIGKILIGLINKEEKDNFGVKSLNGNLSYNLENDNRNFLNEDFRLVLPLNNNNNKSVYDMFYSEKYINIILFFIDSSFLLFRTIITN